MSCLPSINTSGSTIGTIFASCTKAAYLANACELDLIANSEGHASEILYTALHFVNLAPNLKYSANLSLKPSSPSVTFSSGEPASFFAPVATFIPGTDPTLVIKSGIVFPDDVFCLIDYHV